MATTDRIIKTVEKLLLRTGSQNPFDICRELDIKIRYHELGSIKAYYFCQSRIKNIIINSNATEEAQRILCAHELGHAVLHEKIASDHGFHEVALFDSTIPTEYEANLFAAELLICDEDIIEIAEGKSIFEIAQILRIPYELVDFKCLLMREKGYNITPPSLSGSDFLKDKI